MERRTLCTFRVGDLALGVDVAHVQELIRTPALTPVPLAPPVIAGLMNLRGEIVTAIDMHRRLGLPGQASRTSTSVVVRSEGLASLLIDAVGDVTALPAHAMEPAPSTVPASLRELVAGVYKLTDELLVVLDVARVATIIPDRSQGDRHD